ncbi:MAG TPA: 2-dehydro-3-deoxygalactonokinase [Vicinamibacterales bacterium]
MATLVLIDTGTTNTRVWRIEDDAPVRRIDRSVGVRDTAADGSPARLHAALREAIAEAAAGDDLPIVAAGMATSPLGIANAGHVHAPATRASLAAGCQRVSVPAIADSPIVLIPGVRTHSGGEAGTPGARADAALASDVMRGEETLAIGLLDAGTLGPVDVLFTFGSHWKAIGIDSEGRIGWSRTALTGELLDVVRRHTVLAASLDGTLPDVPDPAWCAAGADAVARHGVARTLFGIRLLDQTRGASPAERSAFLLGALAADALPALLGNVAETGARLVLTGHRAAREAARTVLSQLAHARAIHLVDLERDEVERAWIAGALAIWGSL